jgi:hypothetical protein
LARRGDSSEGQYVGQPRDLVYTLQELQRGSQSSLLLVYGRLLRFRFQVWVRHDLGDVVSDILEDLRGLLVYRRPVTQRSHLFVSGDQPFLIRFLVGGVSSKSTSVVLRLVRQFTRSGSV